MRRGGMAVATLRNGEEQQDQAVIHQLPIQERIDWLSQHAQRHSQMFQSPESSLARKSYFAQHPTAIMAFMCMDGRVNIPVATNTPLGIIRPFRNLGGRFDLGWPHLGDMVAEYVQRVAAQGRQTLALLTYHYSKGHFHRGCAGFNYDADAARAHAAMIKRQIETIFGAECGTVYPVVCGFETDEDALVLHGYDGGILDLSTLSAMDYDSLPAYLSRLFPDMAEQMRQDMLPLLRGNIAYVDQMRRSGRELNVEHREWSICIGRGFDWLHMPNTALISGPYSPDGATPVRQAAGIIEANMQSGRIPTDGFLLLAATAYREVGIDRARAELRSEFLSDFAAAVIRSDYPKLAEMMDVRTAVLAWQTRSVEMIFGRAA